MTKNLASTIGIDASPERVWQVLTDFAAYPEWNPFIVRAGTGESGGGVRSTVPLQPVEPRAVTLVLTVLDAARAPRCGGFAQLGIPASSTPTTLHPDPAGGAVVPPRADRAVPRLSRAAHGPVPRPPHVARIQGHERGAQATGRTRPCSADRRRNLARHAPARSSPSPGNRRRPRAPEALTLAALADALGHPRDRPSTWTCGTKAHPGNRHHPRRIRTGADRVRSRRPGDAGVPLVALRSRPTARLPCPRPGRPPDHRTDPYPATDARRAPGRAAAPLLHARLAPHGPAPPGPSSTA